MALVVVVEDGSGLANANSYISAADADAFFDGHVYNSTWLDKATSEKEQALVHATRMLDQQVQWNGSRAIAGQALQWPRVNVIDPDDVDRDYLASDELPQFLLDATCELAQEIFVANPAVRAEGEGIENFKLDGVLAVTFKAATAKKPIPDWLANIISKYGSIIASRSTVKLVRV
jgi:hypothetical protein